MNINNFSEALEVLQNREAFLTKLSQKGYSVKTVMVQALLIFIFTFFYGLIMGSYNSGAQALATGVKLWALIMLTLIICFPSFYIVQLILGSRIKIGLLISILLSGFTMLSVTMLAFAPIVLFFQLSGDNYHFLQLLHVFVFTFSGIFGMKIVLDGLTAIFEEKNIYPKSGLLAFKIWVFIFAFVGIQLSWNMRPFIGSKGMLFELFRTETRGNFYSTVLSSIGTLINIKEENKQNKPIDLQDQLLKDSVNSVVQHADSIMQEGQ